MNQEEDDLKQEVERSLLAEIESRGRTDVLRGVPVDVTLSVRKSLRICCQRLTAIIDRMLADPTLPEKSRQRIEELGSVVELLGKRSIDLSLGPHLERTHQEIQLLAIMSPPPDLPIGDRLGQYR